VKFSPALPTCAEGLGFPIGFATPDRLVNIVKRAEELGFYAVMANDHLVTPRSLRDDSQVPPSFYEPLMTFAYAAAQTSRIRLMTGLIVLPLREPVMLAKQLTTLDHLCDGRLTVGVGAGIYRDEFEMCQPGLRRASRGELVDEQVQALRLLLDERRATFNGRHYSFEDVELYPKARQPELPLLMGGNTDRTLRRAALYGNGWLPAGLGPEQIARGKSRMMEYAAEAGRDPAKLSVALQLHAWLGASQEEAERYVKTTKAWQQWTTVDLHGVTPQDLMHANLIGTPEEICRRVARFREAGVDHLAGLVFLGNDPQVVGEQLHWFSESVMAAFPE
jgi:probable F420-dependent oxidoreductase